MRQCTRLPLWLPVLVATWASASGFVLGPVLRPVARSRATAATPRDDDAAKPLLEEAARLRAEAAREEAELAASRERDASPDDERRAEVARRAASRGVEQARARGCSSEWSLELDDDASDADQRGSALWRARNLELRRARHLAHEFADGLEESLNATLWEGAAESLRRRVDEIEAREARERARLGPLYAPARAIADACGAVSAEAHATAVVALADAQALLFRATGAEVLLVDRLHVTRAGAAALAAFAAVVVAGGALVAGQVAVDQQAEFWS